MIFFETSLRAWGTADFQSVFKSEVSQLKHELLPLQKGLITANYVSDMPITVAIHSAAEMEKVIRVKSGIFYQGIIGGCSCTDDPTPASDINEYCEVQFDIDKSTAVTTIFLLAD
jgi:hypothetical protein